MFPVSAFCNCKVSSSNFDQKVLESDSSLLVIVLLDLKTQYHVSRVPRHLFISWLQSGDPDFCGEAAALISCQISSGTVN